MRKYSRQREAICEYLSSRKDHPTADMVFQAVRQVYPKISLGTVYRNLTLLASEGEILRLPVITDRRRQHYKRKGDNNYEEVRMSGMWLCI